MDTVQGPATCRHDQALVHRLSVQRLWWRCAYPFARAGHRLFGLSYKWVNAGIGAWHRDLFDPLWQHEWYGDEIPAMPPRVNLRGSMYDVSIHEGMVTFVDRDSFTRLTFERDPHDRYGFLWYYEGSGRVAATHLEHAYKWIKAVYGGSHELKRPAI